VNEERYQQLFDHPEELRKIITYAKKNVLIILFGITA